MKIFLYNNFKHEKKYIIECFLNVFGGIENYEIFFCENKYYEFELDNCKKLSFKDSFFAQINSTETYLKTENIPVNVDFSSNRFTKERDIPVIFGSGNISEKKDEIICDIDIFAGSFFLLSRWEEYVIGEKDEHNRFPENTSFVLRNKLNFRPIVNEYFEMFKSMFTSLQPETEFKQHNYTPIFTHDIDFLARFDTLRKFLKTLGGDILKRKSLKKAVSTSLNFLKTKMNFKKDDFDTFDLLMKISEKKKLKSVFYFIAAKNGETDFQYDLESNKTLKIISEIKKRGHILGIHGSYDSYNDNTQFKNEIERFEKQGIIVKNGRQHFLRFSVPLTWQILEDNRIEMDSSMGFSQEIGFRCGTCFEFPVFNIISEKKLNLHEIPLIFMDSAAQKRYSETNSIIDSFNKINDIVKNYTGNFVILIHNSNFERIKN